MMESEAVAEISLLAAFWPRTPLETILAVAKHLQPYDLEDVQAARHTVATWQRTTDFPPIGYIEDAVKAARAFRLREQTTVQLPGIAGGHLGVEEVALRARRLRVGIDQGLRGRELLDFTLVAQECDNWPAPSEDDRLRELAAVAVAAEAPRRAPDHSGCKGNALPPAWVQREARCQVCGAPMAPTATPGPETVPEPAGAQTGAS